MTTNVYDIDVESPKPLELSFTPFKHEESSVGTHLSDSDSDFEPSSHSRARYVTPLRKLAMVAILATLLGLSAGFSARYRSANTSSTANSAGSETPSMETVVTNEEGHRAAEYSFTASTQPPVYTLTVPQTTVDYTSRVEGTPAGATVGVVTVQTTTPSQTGFPFETKPPAFTGTVGIGATPAVEWPQLLGLPAEQAKKIIEDEGKGYTVIIVPPGGETTKDLRYDRVFLFVNEQGYVKFVPRTGR